MEKTPNGKNAERDKTSNGKKQTDWWQKMLNGKNVEKHLDLPMSTSTSMSVSVSILSVSMDTDTDRDMDVDVDMGRFLQLNIREFIICT